MPKTPDSRIIISRPDAIGFEFHDFWSKVNKDGPIPKHRPELGPCWIWIGKIRPNGYGMSWNGASHKEIRAHRASYFIEFGYTHLDVCHRCDNPPCVRPSHLFAGTKRDNLHDMHSKGRQFTKLTESQVLEVLSLRAGGMTKQALSDLFGVSMGCIGHIYKRRHWKHIKWPAAPPSQMMQPSQ